MNIKDKIFPTPASVEMHGGAVRLGGGICAEASAEFAIEPFIHLAEELALTRDAGGNLLLALDETIEDPEGYRIEARDGAVRVSAKTRGGFAFAAATLVQIVESGSIPAVTIADAPLCPVRGAHFYLPPSDEIPNFLRLLDGLARLKYNTVFLEIGGGVEYERHPEINVAWKKFCRDARSYPGGPEGLQASEAHWKDSTHVELAGGGVLTKAELKQIADHVRFLGMELIPEIQALSHAYYLTLSHPEIAEQPFEPYPDTWCPMNDESYRLYEEVAQELHELLGFDKVSIGHDEIRILGKCPRCREKSGAELLAHDLNRLHEIYERMGVRIYMWGESLQNHIDMHGKRVGEAICEDGKYGRLWQMDETHDAIDMIPRDITMLDWRWGHSIYSTADFSKRGISFLYGNFYSAAITHWDELVKNKGFLGGEVSMWCVSDYDEIGRNGWFREFLYSAEILWDRNYDEAQFRAHLLRVYDEMPAFNAFLKRRMGTREYFAREFYSVDGEKHAITPMADSRASALLCEHLPTLAEANASEVTLHIGKRADTLTFLHAVDFGAEKSYDKVFTWFFSDRTPLVLGYYSVTYEDGLVYSFPLEYGHEIGDRACDFDINKDYKPERVAGDEDGRIHPLQPCAVRSYKDQWVASVSAFADSYPMMRDGAINTAYAYTFENRRPDVPICEVKFYPLKDRRGTVLLSGIFA